MHARDNFYKMYSNNFFKNRKWFVLAAELRLVILSDIEVKNQVAHRISRARSSSTTRCGLLVFLGYTQDFESAYRQAQSPLPRLVAVGITFWAFLSPN